MILRVEGRTHCGAVVDLRDRDADVDGSALAAAIRGEDSPYGAQCSTPTEVHERAGFVRRGTGLATRTALAAAGRSRGLATPSDDELAAVRDDLAALRAELAGDGDAVTRAGTGTPAPDADRDRLRERVAELRGRVRALEAADRDPSDARSKLRDAARRLSELETRRVAAVETRERARELRDRRDRLLRLEDRAANLERDARAHLVDELRGEFAAAVDDLHSIADDEAASDAGDSGGTDPFAVDPVTASLAVLRVARVRAPVVLAVDRFESPAAAAEWLDAPVVAL